MSYKEILYEVKDNVAWITINRPEVRNAFREQTLDELIDAFKSTKNDQPAARSQASRSDGNGTVRNDAAVTRIAVGLKPSESVRVATCAVASGDASTAATSERSAGSFGTTLSVGVTPTWRPAASTNTSSTLVWFATTTLGAERRAPSVRPASHSFETTGAAN